MIPELGPYPAYRRTGIDWMGAIPAHWGSPRLASVICERGETNKDGRITDVLSVVRDRGVIPYAERGNSGNKKSEDITRYKIVRPDDIVMNSMNVIIGSVGLSRFTGCLSPVYYVLRTRGRDFTPRYFDAAFQVKPFQQGLVRIGNGILAHRMRIPMELLKCELLPVPPSEEQSAIVRFLDHVDRRIRRYIRAKQKLIKLLEEQKQAIIHQAVTRGLDPDVRMKPSGVERLGEVPRHWEMRRLKAACSRIIDCKNRTPDFVEGGSYRVVRTTNIRNGRFNIEGSYPTDRKNYEIWTQRGAPELGDVFFTREAPAGEACLVPNMAGLCMGQRMMYFRPDPGLLDARFLLYSL